MIFEPCPIQIYKKDSLFYFQNELSDAPSLRITRMNPRGRWRRRRNLRRVPTTEASRRAVSRNELQILLQHQAVFRSPCLQYTGQVPVVKPSFSWIYLHICIDMIKNGTNKKKLQTDVQRKSGSSETGRGPRFDHSKSFLYSGNLTKPAQFQTPESS